MNNSPFRVAFWGLLAGFALSIALAATDPEEIRQALDTPPPADFDATESPTLLAGADDAANDSSSNLIAAGPKEGPLVSNPSAIGIPPVPDHRLALDPERPLLVPPFEGGSVARHVPLPPELAEHPMIEFDAPDDEGVPIEFDLGGGRPRIHVVVSPPRPRPFEELPPPPLLAQEETGDTSPVVPFPVPLVEDAETGSRPAPLIGQLDLEQSQVVDPLANELDELRSLFKQEMRSLRDEVQNLAAAADLDTRRAEILEARQDLDRERAEQQFALLRQDLDRLRNDILAEEPIETELETPRVVITPSNCMPGRIDIELNSAPAEEAFACLGRLSGQNLLTSDEVQGNVTAKLQGISPWEAVLALARSRNCRIICVPGGMMVTPETPAD